MRIILATPIFPPEAGGPATYTVELAMRLRALHEVIIVAYADDAKPIEDVRLVTVSKRQIVPLRLVAYYFALARAARGADIIYVQNAVAAGLPAMLAGKKLQVPVVLKFVGDEAWERATQARRTKKQLGDFYADPPRDWRTKLFIAIQRFVLTRVSVVTTPSAYLAELLVAHYGVKKENTLVNYNAVDPLERADAPRMQHQIFTAVRLVSWKGVDGIIRALSLLKINYPDAKLIIAGDGPEKAALEQLAVWQDVAAAVTFLGRVSKEKVLEVECTSGVQVLNSWYEGLPHGALESFATYTPLVATDIPGTREAVIDGMSGLLVPPGNDAALTEAIQRLFNDEELRAKVTAGGSALLRDKFSWEAHLKNLLAVFTSAQQN